MLQVDGLSGGYGALTVLREVTLSVRGGEMVVLLGINGAGKSTLLRCISGLLPVARGQVAAFGDVVTRTTPHELVRRGLSHVPEGRGVFRELTVEENLELGSFAWARGKKARIVADLGRVYDVFPPLQEQAGRLAGTLSGGQQQMLAIGRALMARPKLLLLDEPSQGLAPLVVQSILDTLVRLRTEGLGILLVEQHARAALARADRAYVLHLGTIVREGPAAAIAADASVRGSYLGSNVPLGGV